MKSRQIIWLLLICLIINLPTISAKNLDSESIVKKVFIILRAEQNPESLENFKSLITSNLELSEVHTQVVTYKVTEPLPQMKIFKQAYQENFDIILLIDQIANYNIDLANSKVNVGGKFTLQSFPLRSTNPEWIKHGEASCNIEVEESIQNFSKRIINSISSSDLSNLELLSSNETEDSETNEIIVESFDMKEIIIPEEKIMTVLLLQTQIELQKTKTKRIESEIELLIIQAENELLAESEKNKMLQLEIKKMRSQASL